MLMTNELDNSSNSASYVHVVINVKVNFPNTPVVRCHVDLIMRNSDSQQAVISIIC